MECLSFYSCLSIKFFIFAPQFKKIVICFASAYNTRQYAVTAYMVRNNVFKYKNILLCYCNVVLVVVVVVVTIKYRAKSMKLNASVDSCLDNLPYRQAAGSNILKLLEQV